MCDECHQYPHATMCPNNPALADDEPIMKRCPICEREFDEEEMTWSVCDECIEKASTMETAVKYGESRKEAVAINGFHAWAVSELMIGLSIAMAVMGEYIDCSITGKDPPHKQYLSDDKGDFADWLVERKKGGG